MSETATFTKPFGAFERSLAWRYLRARREHGGVALVAIISFIGIALAVAALIIIMSIMSGFRGTLLDTLLGGKGEVYAYVQEFDNDQSDEFADRIRNLDGIKAVHGMHEGQVLVQAGGKSTGAIVRVVRPDDLDLYRFIRETARIFERTVLVKGAMAAIILSSVYTLLERLASPVVQKLLWLAAPAKLRLLAAPRQRRRNTRSQVYSEQVTLNSILVIFLCRWNKVRYFSD